MPQIPWTIKKTQFNQEMEQALLSDEQTLVSFSQDFGQLIQQKPAAVFQPNTISALQHGVQFAYQHGLPITVRGNGLSQSGQSLPIDGGITISMQAFDRVLEDKKTSIWVEGNTAWSSLLQATLSENKMPPVLPYNCNLSVGGVLSAGGVGASSFQYGPVVGNVAALEILDGMGQLQTIDASSPLFHACLGGQGQFGIITKASLKLKTFQPQLKTWCLVYDDMTHWLHDFEKVRKQIDYVEMFCSPCMQGSQITPQGRLPLVQWLFGLHISMEFTDTKPDLPEVHPWKILHSQEEGVDTWVFRHNGRFENMHKMGQWTMLHPWYECFVSRTMLEKYLPELLASLPLYYANLVQIVPIKPFRESFFQLPDGEEIYAFMILNPGLAPFFKEDVLKLISRLDALWLPAGGKRYLSGYLGENIPVDYWKNHFGKRWETWLALKQEYDPAGIFCSRLFSG